MDDYKTKLYDGEVLNECAPPMLEAVAEAIEEVDYRMHLLANAKTIMDMGEAMSQLYDAISQLNSWHPGYSYDGATLPWERKADDEV